MTFSWNQPPCGQRNGNVTTYQLSIVNTADGSVSTRNISCTTETFTGLVPYTDYNLSVSAVNQFGSGPFASAMNMTLEGSKFQLKFFDDPIRRSNGKKINKKIDTKDLPE